MLAMSTLEHTAIAVYWIATMAWLIWCQLRRGAAFNVVVGDSWLMLSLALVITPVICLIIHKVHRWQLRQGDEHEHHAI
jgi:hypothetical protein